MGSLVLMVFAAVLLLRRDFIVDAISCYKCQSASSSSLCISDNDGGGSSSVCDKKYCTIYRDEYLDPVGKIRNFYRSCEDKPSYLNAIIDSPNRRVYYRTCATDLCNTGDGIAEFNLEYKKIKNQSSVHIVRGVGYANQAPLSSINYKLIIYPTLVIGFLMLFS